MRVAASSEANPRSRLTLIAELCSFGTPAWLGGFQDPAFPVLFADYARAIANTVPGVIRPGQRTTAGTPTTAATTAEDVDRHTEVFGQAAAGEPRGDQAVRRRAGGAGADDHDVVALYYLGLAEHDEHYGALSVTYRQRLVVLVEHQHFLLEQRAH